MVGGGTRNATALEEFSASVELLAVDEFMNVVLVAMHGSLVSGFECVEGMMGFLRVCWF